MPKVPRPARSRTSGGGRLRLAKPSDAPALIALEAASFKADCLRPRQWRYLLRRPSAEIWLEELVLGERSECTPGPPELRAAMVLLFRRGTRLARIYSLATASQWRGQGLAGKLLALAERRACLHNCDRMALEVREDNTLALGLYQRSGYAVRRRLVAYYADGSDGLRLEKFLACP